MLWDSGLHNLPARPPHSSPAVPGKTPYDGRVGGRRPGLSGVVGRALESKEGEDGSSI